MAYDTALAERVRSILSSRSNIEEQSMFGGLTFKMNGNMVCAVKSNGTLDARVGKEKIEEASQMPNVKQSFLGTKPMPIVNHSSPSSASDEDLAALVNMAADVVETLPPKEKK